MIGGEEPTPQLLVLDHDVRFAHSLTQRLDDVGWPHRVHTGAVPCEALVAMRLGAIVVDPAVARPAEWGYLEALCGRLPGMSLVVCTGPSTVAQRVRGLRLGADDWITKPCHPLEVVARLQAIVRRRRGPQPHVPELPLRVGELEIDAGAGRASVGDTALELTPREFELLALMARTEGRVLPREDIYERVWGYAMARGDRSVDVYTARLRHKLKRISPDWRYIHTHFGIGYRFAPATEVHAAPVAARPPEPILATTR